ncbi:recombination regulator RecX [Liquorilactobacillus oeni]|uniref:Regulatory protein RecX n=1 Tax=Liquorilactobacillus oeni DSM 19972 TaxID=1423777 RepID=A0A0R1MCV2_9LACO|nr:recombination regulator RecX [Liquorilactobacillus oeni]KRL05991.1 recombination regulator RecX [Liquorilactobacillus oeni DSM 19972]
MTAKITRITTQKRKGRFNIFLDDEYSFSVSENVLTKYRLHKGQEINAQLQAILTKDETLSQFYEKALNYLSYQMRSEKELRLYLKNQNAPVKIITQVQKKLRTEALLDDHKFAASYVRTMVKTADKGFKMIAVQLRKKGISEEIIEDAATEYDRNTVSVKVSKLIEKLMKQYRNDSSSMKFRKVKQRLLAKGFSVDEINTGLENTTLKDDPELEEDALNTQFNKLINKYHSLQPAIKKLKIKQALYRKGFKLSDIDILLENKF